MAEINHIPSMNAQSLGSDLVSTGLHAALGYLRWSQMVPMLTAWAFAVIAMLGALLVGFEEEGVGLLIWLNEVAGRVPGLREWVSSGLQESGAVTESGGIRLTDEMIVPVVVRSWAILAGVLFAAEWLWRTLTRREPAPHWRLRRKLLLALVACLCAVGLAVFGFAAAGAGSAFSGGDAVLAAGIACLVLFIVTAYSLTLSHGIAKLQRMLDGSVRISS